MLAQAAPAGVCGDRTRLAPDMRRAGRVGGRPHLHAARVSGRLVVCHCTSVNVEGQARDLADVPAVEVISAAAVHLMSAAAVKLGLAEDGEHLLDLDEARRLITSLAGLVTASAEYLGLHAGPIRDGLRSLQLAFREASREPDLPGQGPGERWTGPVW